MIKQLQKRFIMITAVSVAIVMTVLLVGINVANLIQVNRDSDALIKILSDNNGVFPDNKKDDRRNGARDELPVNPDGEKANQPDGEPGGQQDGRPNGPAPEDLQLKGAKENLMQAFGTPFSPETKFRTRYFSVIKDENGAFQINTDNIAAVTQDEAQSMAEYVLSGKKKSGYSGNYRFKVSQNDKGTLVVFLDCEENLRTMRNFALLSAIVGLVCLIIVIILVTLLSKRAIKPAIESMQKQKRFITDAGHEIKTPLAIISANAEVIEMTSGESEWTASIRNQVERLNELVKSLLELSRLDEVSQGTERFEFNLSDTVEAAVETFSAPMQTRGITCSNRIEKGIILSGNKEEINRLTVLLMDNAVKYCTENSAIEVGLCTNGRKAELSVYNPCDNELPDNLGILFDRFYRVDASRSRKTGGYGIGLSVAQAIVNSHKGKIHAERREHGVCFIVQLPLKS